jgi:protein-disulfide isomerase
MAKNPKKQSKSERAQALLQEQRRRERIRNLSVVGSVLVAVLIVFGVLFFVQSNSDKTGKALDPNDTPKNLTGTYDVVVGKSSAPLKVKLYEDLQCPICKQFESLAGQPIADAISEGKAQVDYHMVAFLDRSSTTHYSSRALNAAMAVLSTAGPDSFLRFKAMAYTNQPAEGSAGVPDSTLIDWAVQAGADESTVTPLIENNVYHQWVLNATDQMSKDHVTGTPTIFINGKDQGSNPSVATQALLTALKK